MGSFLCLVEPVLLRLVAPLVLWWTDDEISDLRFGLTRHSGSHPKH